MTPSHATTTIATSLAALVGSTPLFLWRRNNINFYLKLEMFNPGRSIKDRVAFFIADSLVHTQPPACIVEYSSGNLGIGLALSGLAFGIEIIVVVTDKTSQAKLMLLDALSASVIITKDSQIMTDRSGMIGVAEYVSSCLPDSYFLNQFHNPLNPQTHYIKTGPELWQQLEGNIDYIFAPLGTGGTITGIGRFIKEQKSKVNIIGATPRFGVYYTRFHGLPDLGRKPASDTSLEGVGGDFLPKTLDLNVLDGVVEVEDEEAYGALDSIKREKGLFLGGSSGLSLAAALGYNFDRRKDINVVVVCSDGGDLYLSKSWMQNIVTPSMTRRKEFLKDILSPIQRDGFPYIAWLGEK